MEIGQHVWHIGKNVAQKEVIVRWMSPNSHRNSHFQPEAPVLVERLEGYPFATYALIPVRQLTETKPVRRCSSIFLPHINAVELHCDRDEGHDKSIYPFEALHRRKTDFKEIYWSNDLSIT